MSGTLALPCDDDLPALVEMGSVQALAHSLEQREDELQSVRSQIGNISKRLSDATSSLSRSEAENNDLKVALHTVLDRCLSGILTLGQSLQRCLCFS